MVFVNVLDPTKHKASKEETVDVTSKKSVIETEGVLLKSLVVNDNDTPLTSDQDYIATFNEDGKIVIAVLKENISQLKVKYDYLTPDVITNNHIIGGYDISTGKSTGLELLNNIFPKFSMVPGLVLAPKFSKDPTVAAVMKAKASSINTYFKGTIIG